MTTTTTDRPRRLGLHDLHLLSEANVFSIWKKVQEKRISLSQAGLLMYLLTAYWHPSYCHFDEMTHSGIARELGMTASAIGAALKKLVDAEVLVPASLDFGCCGAAEDFQPNYLLHPSIYDEQDF